MFEEFLENKMHSLESKYKDKTIEKPDFWGGYRLIPTKIEFWQGRPSRLHDRLLFTASDDLWTVVRLAP